MGAEGHAVLPGLAPVEGRQTDNGCYYISHNFRGFPVIELKVRKFGNSLGVILPKEVIGRLRTEDGQPLYLIEAPDGGYRLTPYDPAFEQKMAKAEDLMARYRNTLHVLAQ